MDTKTHAVLFPGRKVELPETGVVAVVYPISIRHIQRFSRQIQALVEVVATTPGLDAGMGEDVLGRQVLARLVPHVAEHLLDLVAECTRFEPAEIQLGELPHWDLPTVLTAWLEENFADPRRLAPWREAIDRIVRETTGRQQTSEMPSSSSSPMAIPGPTSSKLANRAIRTAAGAPVS